MKKEELLKLKEWIMNLSEDDKKERNVYLAKLARGELLGPPVGYASIDKPWLKSYKDEVIVKDPPKMRMFDYLHSNNKENKDGIAINYFGHKITYQKLFNNIELAMQSFAKMGVEKGDVVTICMPTLPESIYAMYALNRLGAVANLLDPRVNVEQIQDSLVSTNSKYAVIIDLCHPKFDRIIQNTNVQKIISVSVRNSLPILLNYGMKMKTLINYLKSKETPLPKNNLYVEWNDFIEYGKLYIGYFDCKYEENMPSIIVRTSGTTGRPKNVVHSNESVNALAHQYNYCGVPHQFEDRFLNIMPIFLMYGLSCGIHMPLSLGMTNILVPQFDLKTFDKLIYKHKPQHFMGVPAMYERLLDSPKMNDFDLSFLITPGVGGDSISNETHQKINNFLASHGCKYKLEPGYGMTEAGAAVGALINMDNYKIGSTAMPFFNNVISVFDYSVDDDEKINRTDIELGYNEVGEFCYCGPTSMLYYLNNQEATDMVLRRHRDGSVWVHTNDFGYIDEDGLIFYKGRINDERISRADGHKASRSDIEKCLSLHPMVDEITVVAVNDPNSSQFLPKAVIKLKPHSNMSEKEVVDSIIDFSSHYLAARDSAYYYEIVDNFPINDTGKIDRKLLKSNVVGRLYDANIQVESMVNSNKKLTKK